MDIVRTAENYRGEDQLPHTSLTYDLIHYGVPTPSAVFTAAWVNEIRVGQLNTVDGYVTPTSMAREVFIHPP
jgi:hypothetical protein